MGNKVNPIGFRVGVIRGWDGVWFANRQQFKTFLKEDVAIRDYLKILLKEALVDRIEIERSRQEIRLMIYSAKPGIIIGRGGAGIEDLTKKLRTKYFPGRRVKMRDVQERPGSSSPALT